jgi:uncharacterized surface protein with fasciclin (FAS1) repeats
MKRILNNLILIFTCSAVFISSCKKLTSFDDSPGNTDVYSIISDDPSNYSFFKYIVDRAGMSDALKNGGYTVFAPTNQAFSSAGYTTTNMQNIPLDTIALMVKNHLVEGVVDLNTISGTKQFTALSNVPITVQKTGDRLYADGGDITNQSKHVSNGALNTINKLLIGSPSIYERLMKYYTGTTNNAFTMLIAAIDKASQGTVNYKQMLMDPAANYTFFAPTNLAFIKGGYATVAAVTAANANTLGSILANQLVQGRKFTTDLDTTQALHALSGISIFNDRLFQTNRYSYFYVNGLSTSGGGANMMAGESMINAVRRFMPVPVNVTTLAQIQADATLTFFYKALQVGTAAGKYDFIKMLSDNTNSYTVFAITNSGFQANGFPTLQSISDASPSVISDMLLFHMVNKRNNGGNYDDNAGVPTLYMQQNLNGTKTIASVIISNTPAFTVKGPTNPTAFTVLSSNIVTTNGMLNTIGGILTP